MGKKIEKFSIPVCNSFKAKIQNNQLCYEVDLNKHYDKKSLKEGLEVGLVLLVDFNLDRQVNGSSNIEPNNDDKLSFASKFKFQNNPGRSSIFISAIGMEQKSL